MLKNPLQVSNTVKFSRWLEGTLGCVGWNQGSNELEIAEEQSLKVWTLVFCLLSSYTALLTLFLDNQIIMLLMPDRSQMFDVSHGWHRGITTQHVIRNQNLNASILSNQGKNSPPPTALLTSHSEFLEELQLFSVPVFSFKRDWLKAAEMHNSTPPICF